MDIDAMERLGTGILAKWITARKPDPMEGEIWEFWCDVAGVDPEEFAAAVKYQQAPRQAPVTLRRAA